MVRGSNQASMGRNSGLVRRAALSTAQRGEVFFIEERFSKEPLNITKEMKRRKEEPQAPYLGNSPCCPLEGDVPVDAGAPPCALVSWRCSRPKAEVVRPTAMGSGAVVWLLEMGVLPFVLRRLALTYQKGAACSPATLKYATLRSP